MDVRRSTALGTAASLSFASTPRGISQSVATSTPRSISEPVALPLVQPYEAGASTPRSASHPLASPSFGTLVNDRGGGKWRRGSIIAAPPERSKPKFDKCSIWQWFAVMDVDRDGHVSKEEFSNFVATNRQLRQVFSSFAGDAADDSLLDEQTKVLRHGKKMGRMMGQLMMSFNKADTDKSGSLDFEEFLEVFRISGNLLEYQTLNNPRDQLLQSLRQMHTNDGQLNKEQFDLLAQNRLQIDHARRRSLDESIQYSQLAENERLVISDAHGRRPSLQASGYKKNIEWSRLRTE